MTAVLIREASTAQAEVVLSAAVLSAAVLSAAEVLEAAAVPEITTEIPEVGFSFLHIWQWP